MIFTPLLDRTPSDPSIVLTAIIKAEKITNQAGQNITIFTADQKLYRVGLEVMWTEPNRFQNFIPRIGGMYWIISFVESIEVLMKNSGLLPCLRLGVLKNANRKKIPHERKSTQICNVGASKKSRGRNGKF